MGLVAADAGLTIAELERIVRHADPAALLYAPECVRRDAEHAARHPDRGQGDDRAVDQLLPLPHHLGYFQTFLRI